MNPSFTISAHPPGRSTVDPSVLNGNQFVMPAEVITIVTAVHFTPAVEVLHIAQGIVRRVSSNIALPEMLGEEKLFEILSSALSTQFGEPATEGLPALRGPIDASWQLVQLAEHLVKRQVESSVIEAAMKETLR